MKIIRENVSLRYFDFWSGAKDTASLLTDDEFDIIETILEDIYPDGITETALNDLFWFDVDTIAEWLGYENWDELYNDRKK